MATLDDCLESHDGDVQREAVLYLLQHQPALASRAARYLGRTDPQAARWKLFGVGFDQEA